MFGCSGIQWSQPCFCYMFLGWSSGNASKMVSEAYNAGLIAVRSRYWGTAFATDQQDSKEASSPFHRRASANFVAGDVILVMAQTDTSYPSSHFLLVTRLGSLPRPTSFYDLVPLLLFVPALMLTSLDVVSMVQISVTLSTLFIMGGWIKATEIRTIVDWQLLILIGAALGIAQAMSKSGLAAGVSRAILSSGLPNWLTPSLLYLIVMAAASGGSNSVWQLSWKLPSKHARPDAGIIGSIGTQTKLRTLHHGQKIEMGKWVSILFWPPFQGLPTNFHEQLLRWRQNWSPTMLQQLWGFHWPSISQRRWACNLHIPWLLGAWLRSSLSNTQHSPETSRNTRFRIGSIHSLIMRNRS